MCFLLTSNNCIEEKDLLGQPDVCLRQSRLVIGQFGCSGLPPSEANFGQGESLPLKVNVKISQLGTTFLILQIIRNFQIVMITLLCFESESESENCNFINAEKLDFEYLPCTNPMAFFQMLSPFTAPARG